MPTTKEIDAATDAYLMARGWDEEKIASHTITRNETRDRMIAAVTAAEKVRKAAERTAAKAKA